MTAPLPENETERLEWLRQSRILDTSAEETFDDITRLAAQICAVPFAIITLVDEERQWFKSGVGLVVPETPRAVSFCAHTILEPHVMVVPDTTQDDRFKDNPSVTAFPYYRFYAGAPLITAEGFALGSLCVLDRVPRQLTEQQTLLLEILARQVADRIELQRHIVLQKELLVQCGLAEQRLAESEERLLFAVEGAGLGTFHWNLPKRIILWSDISKSLFGLSPEADMTRERLFECLHPDDRARTHEAIEQALTERTIYDTEYRVLWADGSEHWLWARGRGYYGEDGQPLRFEGTIQDIDGRKRAAEQQQTFMRDVLASVTEGKLLLSNTPAQLPLPLSPVGGPILLTPEGGLHELRQRTQQAARAAGMSDIRLFDLITAASEAGMNAIVHGGGGIGWVSAGEDGRVQVRVEDHGKGIAMDNLPRATLSRGFTTAGTLGHGLKMMLETADRLSLLTGPSGTTLVLEQERDKRLPAWLMP